MIKLNNTIFNFDYYKESIKRKVDEYLYNLSMYKNLDGDVEFKLRVIYQHISSLAYLLKKEENNLILEIIDDGIGFNINKAKKGIGLQNIRSRTQECNGTVEINSKMGEGTIIKVTIALG